jgi:hypothetical protein
MACEKEKKRKGGYQYFVEKFLLSIFKLRIIKLRNLMVSIPISLTEVCMAEF